MGVVISVVSAKGGVGKTTFVANVGTFLVTQLKKKVLVVDGNITTPNLGLQLGLLFPRVTLHDVLNDLAPINHAIYIHKTGLHILPASFSIRKHADPLKLKEKIETIKGLYDVILIDGAAGIGEEVVAAIQSSDVVVVVTTPEVTSIVAAMKVIEMARAFDVCVLGMVLNKVLGKKYEMKIEDIEEISDTKVIASIPFDERVPECIAKKTPVVLEYPDSPAALTFAEIANYLVGKSEMKMRKPGILVRIKSFFKLLLWKLKLK